MDKHSKDREQGAAMKEDGRWMAGWREGRKVKQENKMAAEEREIMNCRLDRKS